MKSKFVFCLALHLCGLIAAHSASWPEKAARISNGTTRAQAQAILPVWRNGWVIQSGGCNLEQYWVSTNWTATVWYDDTGGDGSPSNRVAAGVVLDNTPYPIEIESMVGLIEAFKDSEVFYLQAIIGDKLVALHDTNILQSVLLVDDLTNEDRHVRANAAYIFAALGDSRGFDTLQDILVYRSPRPEAQGGPVPPWTLQAQIASDRYYAAHVLGDLKDPRAIPILIPLLADKEVNYIVPWSLAEIGGKRAAQALIDTLDDKNPSMRVLAIYGLEQMHATEALPRLQQMVNDNEHCNVDDLISVGDAARGVITELEPNPDAMDRLAASFSESNGHWMNGIYPLPIHLPSSATMDSVIARIFKEPEYDGRHVKDYQILKSRNVIVLHPVGEYEMVLVKSDFGKKIVMTQYAKKLKGWWYQIYDAGD